MIICRTCQHPEVEGALFCSECGAGLQPMATQAVSTGGMSDLNLNPPPKRDVSLDYDSMALQLLDGGELLTLSEKDELTIGRISDGQVIMPDIDLTSYKAYEFGVSRLHAVLKKRNGQVTIMDLGSSNGTYVDGTRLKPEVECNLSNGNILSLGKLKLQFLLEK